MGQVRGREERGQGGRGEVPENGRVGIRPYRARLNIFSSRHGFEHMQWHGELTNAIDLLLTHLNPELHNQIFSMTSCLRIASFPRTVLRSPHFTKRGAVPSPDPAAPTEIATAA